MTHHKGTVSVCQYPPGPAARETTPLAPDSIDRRLVVRYGAELLTGGYTALPTYAWVYYARLGVTEAEMVCIAQLCTYWWSAREPYPGEAALAVRMGKTVRTIQGYLRSLEGKGVLHIQTRLSTNGRLSTNAYALRPVFAAVEGLARLDGLLPAADAAPAPPALSDTEACKDGPCDHTNATQGDAEQRSLCAGATRVGPDNRPKDDGTPTRGEGEGFFTPPARDPSSSPVVGVPASVGRFSVPTLVASAHSGSCSASPCALLVWSHGPQLHASLSSARRG